MKLDLSSLQSVMDFVEEFKRKGYQLQLLICNAGSIFVKHGIVFHIDFCKPNLLVHSFLSTCGIPVVSTYLFRRSPLTKNSYVRVNGTFIISPLL